MLTRADEDVRGALTRAIARLGCAPSTESLAQELGRNVADVTSALERLGSPLRNPYQLVQTAHPRAVSGSAKTDCRSAASIARSNHVSSDCTSAEKTRL
jgi:hypothetical protein